MQLRLDAPIVVPAVRVLDADEVQRLRELPHPFARAIDEDPAAPDVATVIAEAHELARESSRRASLLRRAAVLAEADDAWTEARGLMEKARARLDPALRQRAAEHATAIVAVDHARLPSDVHALHRAAAWIVGLDVRTAGRVIDAVRRERAFIDADDLRCRAYHAARSAVRRAREKPD